MLCLSFYEWRCIYPGEQMILALFLEKRSPDRAPGRLADYLCASKHAKAEVLLTTVLGPLRSPWGRRRPRARAAADRTTNRHQRVCAPLAAGNGGQTPATRTGPARGAAALAPKRPQPAAADPPPPAIAARPPSEQV